MAILLVRNVDDKVVLALKFRAGEHGISAEAEHRRILEEALLNVMPGHLAAVLALMPDVGIDSDFERIHSERQHSYSNRNSDVFN
jgi:antitoxin FitA